MWMELHVLAPAIALTIALACELLSPAEPRDSP